MTPGTLYCWNSGKSQKIPIPVPDRWRQNACVLLYMLQCHSEVSLDILTLVKTDKPFWGGPEETLHCSSMYPGIPKNLFIACFHCSNFYLLCSHGDNSFGPDTNWNVIKQTLGQLLLHWLHVTLMEVGAQKTDTTVDVETNSTRGHNSFGVAHVESCQIAYHHTCRHVEAHNSLAYRAANPQTDLSVTSRQNVSSKLTSGNRNHMKQKNNTNIRGHTLFCAQQNCQWKWGQ